MPGHGEVAASVHDSVARANPAQWRQIVANIERALALRAKRLRRLGGDRFFAARALQMFDGWHNWHHSRALERGTRFDEGENVIVPDF